MTENSLECQLDEANQVLDAIIFAFAALAETRGTDTGGHIRRTQHCVKALAEHLQLNPAFAGQLDASLIALLFKAAPLHDIGKVGIPERILLKPGRLTPDEFELMKTHTTLGFEAIGQAQALIAQPVPFLQVAQEIALAHQEKWDGSGYPNGLAGKAIPLSARLMALADVYDALTSERLYKASVPHEEAVQIILQGRGTHFDPDVVDAFLEIHKEFKTITGRFADNDSTLAAKMEYMVNAVADPISILPGQE